MPFVSYPYLRYLSPEELERFSKQHMSVGYHPETGDELMMQQQGRYSGTYILGVAGAGKSGLLENMIAHDCRTGEAIIAIDPHGDLIAHCIAQLPPERLAQTYLLDMEDEAWPFGINVFNAGPLTTDIARTQAVDRLMHIFEVLWSDVLSQQHLPRYLRAATIVFLANPGATLVDMYDFLTNDQVRQRMLQSVRDTSVQQFWLSQFDMIPPAERNRRVQPLIARLELLFMGRSLVRNVLGQRRNSISFRQAIEDKEVIFIRLPLKTAKQDAQLIGTILMAQIHAALFSFSNVPEAQRPGFSLYIDEFQNFSTPDIAELFTEGRKFGIKLTIAHQYRGQLPDFLQASTMTARTKICFQTTPEDGREMSHLFPAQAELHPEDIEAHPSAHLLAYGSDDPTVMQFIETYLRPMHAHKRGHRVEIQDIGEGMRFMSSMMGVANGEVFVPEPTPWLDSLLYQVMRSGDPTLSIPREIVRGFANCGRRFFPQVRTISNGDILLSPSVCFPEHLVAETADGSLRWMRLPEGGREQLYHLLFHLRMTMAYLAAAPIGKKSTPGTSAVGQMLTQLPRRAAFVRSGEDVGVIYTHDTQAVASGEDLRKRGQEILQQTRSKYCHPKDVVEQALAQPLQHMQPDAQAVNAAPDPNALPDISRWEEA